VPLALALLGAAAATAGAAAPASAAGAAAQRRASVVLVFLPTVGSGPHATGARGSGQPAGTAAALAGVGGLSVGIMSATEGSYTTEQLLLDITQGARIAASAYAHPRPPALTLRPVAGGAVVEGWAAARRRAEAAPQLLRPGLLASSIPGGGAYAGITGADHTDGAAAADSEGRVAAVSLGSPTTLPARITALDRVKRLVVGDLPGGDEGYAALRALSSARGNAELLLVVQRAADRPGGELLWLGAAGLAGGGHRELTSRTTNQRGLVSAIDLAPTVLGHLRLEPAPADMRGYPLATDGPLRASSLSSLLQRLQALGGRRLRALACLLGLWALLLLAAVVWPGRRHGTVRWALRVGALAILWAPVAALVGAAIEPGAALEYAVIALTCVTLGVLTDRLLPWPRAPLAPAITALVALVADALAHTQLLMRSLFGPNPILGARFYGFGNELKSALAVLALAAVAAALYPAARATRDAQVRADRRAVATFAAVGTLLAFLEGSARVGAGVGGVILVSAGTAIAVVMLLPGRLTRRRALIVLISPVAGLVALAALDLATAHGSGHFSGSILHARSAGDIRDLIVRRYSAAWQELRNHAMPVATAFALLCAAVGISRRERLLAPVGGDRLWLAALAGGLAAGFTGALSEDSGPVLLVVAVFTLGCLVAYLWGRPSVSIEHGLGAPRARAGRHTLSAGVGSGARPPERSAAHLR
jgi:hypothetical protein